MARILVGMSLVLLSLLVGCQPDLGACNSVTAREIVYDTGAFQPVYVGQALMEQSCAAGRCHSESANTNELRRGVPLGLDFDLQVACDLRSGSTECSPNELAKLSVLKENQLRTHDWRKSIFREVIDGDMPPIELDEDGNRVFPEIPYVDAGFSTNVPSLGSMSSIDAVKNWLACGSPVVALTIPADGVISSPGGPCQPEDVELFVNGNNSEVEFAVDCIFGEQDTPPDPHWDSIHERVIVPQCVRCHDKSDPNTIETSNLDLGGGADAAYNALIDASGSGNECGDDGRKYIVAGDSADSMLIDKISGEPSCGSPMPDSTRPVSIRPSYFDAIKAWIDAGAMNDTTPDP